MAYQYGVKNTYRPSELTPNAYGWTKGVSYSAADIPWRWADENQGSGGFAVDVLKQQFAYEWFQSGQSFQGFTGANGMTNPPFVSGAAGRLHPALTDSNGKPARILRGYIRRADYEIKDPLSKCRLYFMYNPETISREYVSYLEQSALDPFNTVYQSGNLIAPPSILNFSFELFFDRQEEAMNADHPGVFVDYQFFDMVVRNVIPQDPNQTNSAIPDNGVMMVNPRDITVVFSPQLTVQGRPTNASVIFEKFTHRMVPTRMRIRLQILASYFGPVKDMVEYKAEELINDSENTVPIDQNQTADFGFNFGQVEDDSDAIAGGGVGQSDLDIEQQLAQSENGNRTIRLQALQWAQAHPPSLTTGPMSSAALMVSAYRAIKQDVAMGWGTGFPSTATIMQTVDSTTSYYKKISELDYSTDFATGDLLIKDGSVVFFVSYLKPTSDHVTGFNVYDNTGAHSITLVSFDYTHLLRPTPLGSAGSAAQATNYNSGPSRAVHSGATGGVLSYSQTVEALTGLGKNIRLSPEALPAWNDWHAGGGAIPCTSGWRDPVSQQNEYEKDKAKGGTRFAPAASSFHCKGTAVDVDMPWLAALSASEQTRFRNAAAAAGWGQARWRKVTGPEAGYECPCNFEKGTKVDEPWHFSWGGCG